MILVTSLKHETYPAGDVVALYRLRWRIELAFKRLKSVIGLRRRQGSIRSAKPYVLAHLLMILVLDRLSATSRTLPLGCGRLTKPGGWRI